eukprot:scaffold289613_cov20-Prasinocladus_malaysianus.AAC.1
MRMQEYFGRPGKVGVQGSQGSVCFYWKGPGGTTSSPVGTFGPPPLLPLKRASPGQGYMLAWTASINRTGLTCRRAGR